MSDVQEPAHMFSRVAVHSRHSRFSKAVADVTVGLRQWELWGTLGLLDIRQRYRRSIIGPFWLTLSMGTMIGTLGFLYSSLFGQSISEFLPYLGLGFITWTLIASIMLEGCNAFILEASVIRHLRTSMSGLVFRMIWRNLIIFGHNFIIYLLLILVFGIWPTPATLLVIPGLVIICLNGVWVGLLFGLISTRYRDVPPIVASVVQIMFLLSPIIWKKEMLSDYEFIVLANPFYHFVEIIRMPLLGQAPASLTWLIVLGVTICGYAVAFTLFARFRERIAFWV